MGFGPGHSCRLLVYMERGYRMAVWSTNPTVKHVLIWFN